MNDPIDPVTHAVRAGLDTDHVTGAVVPPLHLSSTYTFLGYGERRTYDYSRSGNPTRDLLGNALAQLEGGADCVITGTGMSAIALVGQILPQGARIVAPHDCYGGTFRLFTAWNQRNELQVDFVRFADEAALEAALSRKTDLLWIETPSNPLLRITDIEALVHKVKGRGTLVAVDNTFLSPLWQQPLAFGADIVVHSTTKYLNGHSDVVGGAVVARDRAVHERLAWWANAMGITGSPFDSYLILRGLRTLDARLAVHGRNAAHLAAWLQTQPGIRKVYYPGLADHPGHELARRQQKGFGAMVSIELEGGIPAVKRFLDGLQHFSLAESLGGVESLVAHAASMTHAAMAPEAREAAGLVDGLLRLSIGIEAVQDLQRDLAAALARARG